MPDKPTTVRQRAPFRSNAADKLRDAAIGGDLDDPEATQTLAAIKTDGPLEARAGNGQLPAVRDLDDMAAGMIDRHVRTLARLAELRRAETARHATKVRDLDAVVGLAGLLAEATGQLADLDAVTDDTRQRIAATAQGWVA